MRLAAVLFLLCASLCFAPLSSANPALETTVSGGTAGLPGATAAAPGTGAGAAGEIAAGPRIGLVLAGGGARGIAHIGVLKYLEEQGIRADFVAGTSMGSIIAGLYASGLSAAEIEDIALSLDWKRAFDDRPPRDQLSFRDKQEDYGYLVGAKLRYKDGEFRIPAGLIGGQNLNLMLHEMVRHVSHIEDFDQLPIPFRAVAADIATGDEVVLDRGDLAVAMRASMSIPGVFTPTELDGRLLVDGGIANNIPVSVVQAMGADRLIVIDVGTPLAARDEIDNVLSLMGQLTTIMTRKNSEQQIARMGPGDILISPPLDDAGILTASFDKAREAIDLGYASALAAGDQLLALRHASEQSAPADAATRLVSSPLPQQTAHPVITRIDIETDAQVPEDLVRNLITQRIGAPLDRSRLETDLTAIFGLDHFSRVDYSVSGTDEDATLTIRAPSNPQGISYVRLGMSWDQDTRGDSGFGLLASLRQKGINDLGGEWYTRASLGGRSGLSTELYQPLDVRQRYFAQASYEFSDDQLNLAEDGNPYARTQLRDHRFSLGLGVNLGRNAQVRAFSYWANTENNILIGSPILSSSSGNDGGWAGSLRYDTLDQAIFPTSGTRLAVQYGQGSEAMGADADYETAQLSAYSALDLGDVTIVPFLSVGGVDIKDEGVRALGGQLFRMGGFLKLSGYTRDSIVGNYMGLGGVWGYYRLDEQSLFPVDLPVYVGMSLEAGNAWIDRDDAELNDLIFAGSFFFGFDTPVGPLYLGAGLAEDNQKALYLQLGRIFD